MKLKKLLPIATIVGTASIITPLVTSCGRHQSADLDGNMYDGEYVLSNKHLEAAEHTFSAEVQEELNKKYVDEVVNDYSIFTNDYAYTYLYTLPIIQYAGEAAPLMLTFEYQMFNLKLHVTNIEELGEDEGGDGQVFRATFTIQTEGGVGVDIDLYYETIYISYPLSINMECKDIPYSGEIVEGVDGEYFYGIGLGDDFLGDDVGEFTSTVTDYTSTITKTYNYGEMVTALTNLDGRTILLVSLFDFGWTQAGLISGQSVTLPSGYMFNQTFKA